MTPVAKRGNVFYTDTPMEQIYSTYQTAVTQARAHRAFKTRLAALLRPHNITMMQWSIIGMLADAGKSGLRISDIAHSLDTSLAFITTTVNVLEAKGAVQRTIHGRDNRAKLVRLTDSFRPQVAKIEKEIGVAFYEWLATSINKEGLAVYLQVLEQIAGLGARESRETT